MMNKSDWEYLWSIRDLAEDYSYIHFGGFEGETLEYIEQCCIENHIDYANVQQLAHLIYGVQYEQTYDGSM